MKDYSSYFVIYNLVIGVLLMVSSQRLGEFAGLPFSRRPPQAARVTRIAYVSILAFGSTVAATCFFIYVLFHLLRIGV